jgi:hypothetical protein
MCVWDPYYGVDGPHPYGQWGVYLPNEYVLETLSWMSANHGEFEVLFHPNTGYMVGGKFFLSFSLTPSWLRVCRIFTTLHWCCRA